MRGEKTCNTTEHLIIIQIHPLIFEARTEISYCKVELEMFKIYIINQTEGLLLNVNISYWEKLEFLLKYLARQGWQFINLL